MVTKEQKNKIAKGLKSNVSENKRIEESKIKGIMEGSN